MSIKAEEAYKIQNTKLAELLGTAAPGRSLIDSALMVYQPHEKIAELPGSAASGNHYFAS